MSAALDKEITAAVDWLRQQAQAIPYGELNIKLIMHGGAVTRVERTITAKLQPQAGNGNERIGS